MRRDHPRPTVAALAGVTCVGMMAGLIAPAVVAGLSGAFTGALTTSLGSTMTTFFSNNAPWLIGVLILVLFLAFGWADLLRFSPGRIWAISSVAFRESWRRKVWLITP